MNILSKLVASETFRLCAGFIVLSSSVVLAAEQPNVLFISADDMNCDLGAYGHPLVKTPNLDRLCRLGVRFDAAYCQQPLCGPSRASIMTGLRPDTLDIHTLKHELRQKNPDVVTLGQLFRNNGYYSARAGKIYHYGNPSMIGTDGNDDPATWDERHNPIGIDRLQQEKITRYGAGQEKNRNLGISMAWWDPESRDEEHTDGMVASKIVELIREKKDKAFFPCRRVLQSALSVCGSEEILRSVSARSDYHTRCRRSETRSRRRSGDGCSARHEELAVLF